MVLFSKEKEKIIKKLKDIKSLLEEIKEVLGNENEDLYNDLMKKVDSGIEKVEGEKFHIAFFGAFSDGKSSILSALIKSLDIPISPEPTTDRVKVYEYKDYLIVDTPGLFAKNLEIHDKRTREYISEADVIIYIVEATNPIKESHLPVIRWLMNDLKKIEATIIVINKMDTTGIDLENDKEFQRMCKIKSDEVKKVLSNELNIKNFDRIVCISADPYQLGLSEWFKREKDYRKISRIDNLENVLNMFIEKAKDRLQNESGLSVIKDIIMRLSEEIKNNRNRMESELKILKSQYQELNKSIETFIEEITNVIADTREGLENLRKKKIYKIGSCNKKDFATVLRAEIGEDGSVLKREIELIIQRNFQRLEDIREDILKKFENIFNFYISFSDFSAEFFKKIFGISSKLLMSINRNAILKARDLLSISYKFKPWEAVKLAGWMKGFGTALGIIGDVGGTILEIVEDEEFKNEKQKVLDWIEDVFKKVFEEINQEKIMEGIGYAQIEEIKKVSDLENNIRNLEEILVKIKNYEAKLEEVLK